MSKQHVVTGAHAVLIACIFEYLSIAVIEMYLKACTVKFQVMKLYHPKGVLFNYSPGTLDLLSPLKFFIQFVVFHISKVHYGLSLVCMPVLFQVTLLSLTKISNMHDMH